MLMHFNWNINLCIQSAWVDLRRTAAPSKQFLPGDGFFLYIDGARYLPDTVTVSRVRISFLCYTVHIMSVFVIHVWGNVSVHNCA